MQRTIPFLVARAGSVEEEEDEEIQANADPLEDYEGGLGGGETFA